MFYEQEVHSENTSPSLESDSAGMASALADTIPFSEETRLCSIMKREAQNILSFYLGSDALLSRLEDFIISTEDEISRYPNQDDSAPSAADLNLFGLIDELKCTLLLNAKGRTVTLEKKVKIRLSQWNPPAYLIVHKLALKSLPDMKDRGHRQTVDKHIRRCVRAFMDARNKVVQANMRLVFMVANRYRYLGTSYDDLVQEGNLGLIKAIERFQHERGFRLSTYAYRVISQCIHLAVEKNNGMVRRPFKLMREKSQADQLRIRLEQTQGRTVTQSEIRNALKSKLHHEAPVLASISDASANTQALYSAPGDESTLAAPEKISPSYQAERLDLTEIMQAQLSVLPERDRDIVRMKFGLGLRKEYTLDEISQHIGLSRERVRQIVKRSVAELGEQISGAELSARSDLKQGSENKH